MGGIVIAPDFSALQNDFNILLSNYGNEINMINGVTSMQSFWRLQLEPKRAGDLMIPEIHFGSDTSMPRKLAVANSQVMQNQQNLPVFVRGEINTTTPYVQSQALYTFKLYFRTSLSNARVEIPQSTDMTFLQISDKPAYQATYNGETYNVFEKKFALFPKKSGAITIPPMQFHAYTNNASNNGFDYFVFAEPKAIALATKEIHLSVRDVPSTYPVTAWLPAKHISLTEQWSDTSKNWESGTPVTRTITMEAQGLRADQLPDFSSEKIPGVNIYADNPKRSNRIQNEMVVGTLQQKITYIPSTTESFTLPSIEVDWWNTQTNTHAITQLQEMNVKVRNVLPLNTHTTSALTPAMTALPQQSKIIANAFYTSPWFWIACVLLLAWIATLYLMLRKKSQIQAPKKSVEFSDKQLQHACCQGDALQARQCLLAWAKKQWPEKTFNLTTLSELINEESFLLAIQGLEQALYARNSTAWNGSSLWLSFQGIKNRKCDDSVGRFDGDPLPPLYP